MSLGRDSRIELRPKFWVCGSILPFHLEESGVMTFADDDEGDLRKFPASVHHHAGIAQLFELLFDYCLILAFGHAIPIDQKIVRKRSSVLLLP